MTLGTPARGVTVRPDDLLTRHVQCQFFLKLSLYNKHRDTGLMGYPVSMSLKNQCHAFLTNISLHPVVFCQDR